MSTQHNKYLTFLLGQENYGIPILRVKEIIGMMTITHVPKMPEFIKGVVNLRGKIIPVMDLRLKFGMKETQYDNRTCIIVTEVESNNGAKLSGLIVDTVSEVLEIGGENIETRSAYDKSVEESFMTGIGKVREKVILLIDADKVLSEKEKKDINDLMD